VHIKKNGEYENASVVLITHEDKEYSNSVFKLTCTKSRKQLEDGTFGIWNDLHFRFDIINKNMTYGSNGNYRNVTMNRSDFLSWMISLQQAVNNPDVYKNKIIVKRRLKKNDLIIKFAVSEKLNCNAVLMCILSSQSIYSKVGINGLLFNQFLLQLGKIAVDILNFELNFDNSILLYKNNQHVEYQSNQMEIQTQQNKKIIELLSNVEYNKPHLIEETVSIDEGNKILETNDSHFEIDLVEQTENNDIDNNKDLKNNNSEFIDQMKDVDDIQLEKLFEMRTSDIENPKEIDTKKIDDETTLIKISTLNEQGIEIFSPIFNKAQKNKSIQETGLNSYFCDVLGENDFFLPSCLEADINSLLYLSQIQYANILIQYNKNEDLKNYIDIPLLYNINNDYDYDYNQTRNIYDLIAIYTYMVRYSKSFKVRLSNAIENKEIFTKCFRLIFEPIYMTFLTSNKVIFDKKVEELIFTHYRNLNKIGFFEDWNNKFIELDLSLPSDDDIKSCITELKEYVTSIKGMTTEMIHDKYHEMKIIKLPYKNKFKQEHIFEIVKMECYLDGVKNITESNIKHALKSFEIEPSDETMSYYKKTYITKNEEIILDKLIDETTKDKQSTLHRYVSKYLSDDESYKNELLCFINETGNNNLSITDLPETINIHSIPSDILIALTIWQPKDDFRIKQFSYLIEQVKKYWKTKTDIITEYIAEKKNVIIKHNIENSTDWGAFV